MSSTGTADAAQQPKTHEPLSLPPPPAGEEPTPKLEVGSQMKFDALGPLVVNSDGTLSRIANWPNMTSLERERTIRVLTARNQIRLADQKAKLAAQEGQD
ncbi:uncharacterized protein PHACADRAFT_260076 [Phanerochaete carnosa HHB-10118-sp]|uniref:Uncharacterized protein n=1 Tax=Phanerochaete carnosa (strain HHB-10118-sp) TaxID=650164 RepID=K5W3V7_PHACS|nr:uncharacterized protein PHACADRAFT_260076 [Phanerochaete carnosa HHB-10118-sp]EKM53624.1 hypothetical protein PHACADRAFT_260076 [Phanerochaete carnosa HHB-10118-sp]